MIKINIHKLKKYIKLYPVVFGLGGLLLISGSGYGMYVGVHAIMSSSLFTTAAIAPDAPMIIVRSPTVIPKSSTPVAPDAVEPAIAVNSRSASASPSGGVDSLTPALSSAEKATGYDSTNWAGYVSTSGGFTAISASWTVPRPTGNGVSTSADATWVGIGGITTSDLIQVGTANQVTAGGQVTSTIFYELLPGNAITVTSVPVSPGDVVKASLSVNNGLWTITATNLTTSRSFSTAVNYASSYSSAEWIQEDPAYSNGTLVPFDNFGSVTFSGGLATRSGVVSNLAGLGLQPVTMLKVAGQPMATPSSLTSDGAGFNVVRN